ncbi:MAG: hypothetical protein GY918_08950 [Gammaproteobacteria bacterium]|nr:hypothetical protein [Gammaproteobacteria bacterium]
MLSSNTGDVLVRAAGSNDIRFDSANSPGILRLDGSNQSAQFAGSVSIGGTAAANTIDEYEEGTFTPVIVGATTAGSGTYTTQYGEYVKIGRQVTITIRIDWTAHTGTGLFQINGLPFVASNRNGSSNLYTFNTYLSRVDVGTSGTAPMFYATGNTNYIQGRGFVNDASRVTTVINSDASGSVIAITGTYQV